MNKKQRGQWIEKTKQHNLNKELMIGSQVVDIDGNHGIVVKIIKPNDDITQEKREGHELIVESEIQDDFDLEVDHGTVYVWQSERTQYGDDNCEHYSYLNWSENLRLEG